MAFIVPFLVGAAGTAGTAGSGTFGETSFSSFDILSGAFLKESASANGVQNAQYSNTISHNQFFQPRIFYSIIS